MFLNKKLFNLCTKHGLNFDNVLYLLSIYFNIPTESLVVSKKAIGIFIKEGFLYLKGDSYQVRNLFNENEEKEESTETEPIYEQFRKLFKGIKVGSMGDPTAVRDKFLRFQRQYPQYDAETILEKTKQYINHKNQNNDARFIPQADYFIFKQDNVKGGSEKSTLLSIIEEDFSNFDSSKGYYDDL